MNGAASVQGRYYGGRASGYEERRASRPFWAKENATVEAMLSDLPRDSSILDIPVGTGRYAPIYQRLGFSALGLDVSSDMLDVARGNIASIGFDMEIRRGDALNIESADQSFDAAVCTRLVNWFLPSEMIRTVCELMRVSRRVILSIELSDRKSDKGNQPHRPKDYARALKLARCTERKRVEISPAYWMVELTQ